MPFQQFYLRSRSWSDRKKSRCIFVNPYRRPEYIYGVVIALAGLFQKLLPNKRLVIFHCLKWPWRHSEGSLVAIFQLRVSRLPVTRCLRVLRMFFFQKKHLSFFFPWLIIKRSQNCPDLRSPISKFRDICFIDTGTDINRWKFQGNRSVGVALTGIQTFYEVRSLDVTWWPDLAWPESKISKTYAEKMYDEVCQKVNKNVFSEGERFYLKGTVHLRTICIF